MNKQLHALFTEHACAVCDKPNTVFAPGDLCRECQRELLTFTPVEHDIEDWNPLIHIGCWMHRNHLSGVAI